MMPTLFDEAVQITEEYEGFILGCHNLDARLQIGLTVTSMPVYQLMKYILLRKTFIQVYVLFRLALMVLEWRRLEQIVRKLCRLLERLISSFILSCLALLCLILPERTATIDHN